MTKIRNIRHKLTPAERDELGQTVTKMAGYIYPILYERQKGKCAGCKKNRKGMDIDHKIYHPKITIDHLQLLCRPCHLEKHDNAPILRGAHKRRSFSR